MNLLFSRMIRATKLDPSFFRELVDDPQSQGQAVWVVAIFAMATGFGMFSRAGATAVNVCLVTTFLSWYIWAFTLYVVSTYFIREASSQTDRKTIMRVMAFANAPGVLRVLGVIPNVTLILFLGTTVWIIMASVVGIKMALGISQTGRAIILCLGTWIVAFVVQSILLVLFFSVFGVS